MPFLRPPKLSALVFLAASALALTSCGGGSGPPDEPVVVSVTGLSQSGLVLTLNALTLSIPEGATSLQLGSVPSGSSYAVGVETQPAQETCTVQNGSGTAQSATVTVLVDCVLHTYSIGGTVSGLTDSGLVLLNNGADPTAVSPNATAFKMNTPVAAGGTYQISIETQPLAETCTATGWTGTDVLANVTTVQVQCALWSLAAVNTLYSFTGGTDGSDPSVLFQGADANFYGVTAGTPNATNGTVYQVTPVGVGVTPVGAEKTLYTFNGVNLSGPLPEQPNGLMQASDGNFYGTTAAGGSANYGTFFRLDLSGALTVLHTFTGGNDGAVPTGHVLQGLDGNFYGTTAAGGGSNNNGAIFRISTTGAESVFFSMPPTSLNAASRALLQARDGTLYYASAFNSTTPGGGTVYAVSPAGTATVVYAFNGGTEGGSIGALLEGSDGSLYGFTTYGGAVGGGTVFRLTPSGTLTTLYSFGSVNDGNAPSSLIIDNDLNLYGTTSSGGVFGLGTIFRVTHTGQESILAAFSGGYSGSGPTSLILAKDGTFYGLTGDGGIDGLGAIFNAIPQ